MSTYKVRFRGIVESNKIKLNDDSEFRKYINKFEGKEIAVTISRWTKPRSNNQNAYYWGVVIPILASHFGYDDQEMHLTLQDMFLKDHAGVIPRVKSTSNLSTVEFEEYMSKIRQWSSLEHSIYVPQPNEVEY